MTVYKERPKPRRARKVWDYIYDKHRREPYSIMYVYDYWTIKFDNGARLLVNSSEVE